MAIEPYKLKIMPRAALDLDRIYGYISEVLSAPVAATDLMNKIEAAFMRLQDMPESCPMCSDDVLRRKGYRKLLVGHYIALYTVNREARAVIVMRVVHGRQAYAEFV